MLRTVFGNAGVDDAADIFIPLVGDDAFRVVVHFRFAVFDVFFQMGGEAGRKLQVFQHLLVTLEQFDGKPAQGVFVHLVADAFFDVGQGVFHAATEYVRQFRCFEYLMIFRNLYRSFGNVKAAFAFQGADGVDRGSDFRRQFLQVDGVAVLVHQVHHVDSDDHGQTYFDQLGGEVQVAFQIGAVDDVQDHVGLFVDQVFTGDSFFQRVRGKGIDTG